MDIKEINKIFNKFIRNLKKATDSLNKLSMYYNDFFEWADKPIVITPINNSIKIIAERKNKKFIMDYNKFIELFKDDDMIDIKKFVDNSEK